MIRVTSGRLAAAAWLLTLALLIAPETTRTNTEKVNTTRVDKPRTTDAAAMTGVETGFASAYAPGVMEGVVALRHDLGWWRVKPPGNWYAVAGYVAAMDCSRVGEVATLHVPDGRRLPVLIADCAGDDGPPDRFERMGIIVELDWNLWDRLTAAHGRPLAVGLR